MDFDDERKKRAEGAVETISRFVDKYSNSEDVPFNAWLEAANAFNSVAILAREPGDAGAEAKLKLEELAPYRQRFAAISDRLRESADRKRREELSKPGEAEKLLERWEKFVAECERENSGESSDYFLGEEYDNEAMTREDLDMALDAMEDGERKAGIARALASLDARFRAMLKGDEYVWEGNPKYADSEKYWYYYGHAVNTRSS